MRDIIIYLICLAGLCIVADLIRDIAKYHKPKRNAEIIKNKKEGI